MLNLATISHPKPYKLHWFLKKIENMVVKQQVKVKLSIVYYGKRSLCDIVPMESYDILLG